MFFDMPVIFCAFQVSLKWNSDEAQPGEQVSLTVTVLEPKSQVGVMVMKMSDEALQVDLDLKVKQVSQTSKEQLFSRFKTFIMSPKTTISFKSLAKLCLYLNKSSIYNL